MCDKNYYNSSGNNKNSKRGKGKNRRKQRNKTDWDKLEKEKKENDAKSKENENPLTQYIKSIKDSEISSVFLSDVKISGVGLREIEENERKRKQNLHKQQWQENVLNQKKAELENKEIRDKLKAVQPKKRKKTGKK